MEFAVTVPNAHNVEFVSDAFGWDFPQPMHRHGDRWTFQIDMPEDARLEYQFVVDGKWYLDPGNRKKADNGFGGFNSVFEGREYRGPDRAPEPIIPLRHHRVVMSGRIPKRTVHIYRPVGRYKNLPIMIFADGAEYLNRVKPHLLLQNLAEKGRIPFCTTVFVPPVDRMREYLHESKSYEDFIVYDVLHEVRTRTPSSPNAEDVFVCGASLGGLISLRLAEHHPQFVAGGVQAQSGAFWASPGAISRSGVSKLAPTTKLALDWGHYEGVLTASNERFAQLLNRMDRPYYREIGPEGHNWTAWHRRFLRGAEYLLAGPRSV